MRPYTHPAASLVFTVILALVTAYPATPQSAIVSPEAQITTIDEGIFPKNYPSFLKQSYILFRYAEQLRQLDAKEREVLLKGQPRQYGDFFRKFVEEEQLDLERLCAAARGQVGPNAFEMFLRRFGIESDNQEDIELELLAQLERMRRREAYNHFVKEFGDPESGLATRKKLVRASRDPQQLEYALRHCKEEEFAPLQLIVVNKDGFGPQTSQDRKLLKYLDENRRAALREDDNEVAKIWRGALSQLLSQPVGRDHRRLPFTKSELFAMMRNAERTVEQRKQRFIDVTDVDRLDEVSASHAEEILRGMSSYATADEGQPVAAYAFFDIDVARELEKLEHVYEDILASKDTGQTEPTLMLLRDKKQMLEILKASVPQRIDMRNEKTSSMLLKCVRMILEERGRLHRLPFIRGIIFLRDDKERLAYRFVEEFPMIVAGETYPYQWKHDNEVNIALLLANIDPYEAAQAVRFIIYHYMWKSQETKQIGMYGWIPQIVFGDRQTRKLPEFNNRRYHYFPDFRFRPTRKIDAENERNRTSEIMQLPFFGWTVWRVYEELKEVDEEHALGFLKETYPYVRANTESIRTALDPYDEAVLSGRDAWVNGMDNAWYHLMVMRKHLPERVIPRWAKETVQENRVDNRVDRTPGNPVDMKLAQGRPSDYYYAFKLVFYNIIRELGLDPTAVYHATPYNAKDVAITAVMARSLESQIEMANVLKNTDADVLRMTASRGPTDEPVDCWNEEIKRYQMYLNRMKAAVNQYLWSPEDKTYYNRDVTQIFPSIVEQQFCRVKLDDRGRVHFEPRLEYWCFEPVEGGGGQYVLNRKAQEVGVFDEEIASVKMDLNGRILCEYKSAQPYWEKAPGRRGTEFRLNVRSGDPFVVEQFCDVEKDESGNISYEPNPQYWTWVADSDGGGGYELNDRARSLMGKGARKIENGDLLRSPAIAGFFPLFGRIPSDEQAFQLSMQLVNPRMWWPVDGIPIPTQPMRVPGRNGRYVSNDVYDPNMYWLGPTWMASNKPVMDGFRSYGFQMIYLYLVQRTARTLQDGRAVEHWRPETGEVNTSNINFPWTASCIAGSIWEEMTEDEQDEYLNRFHTRGSAWVFRKARSRQQRRTVPSALPSMLGLPTS